MLKCLQHCGHSADLSLILLYFSFQSSYSPVSGSLRPPLSILHYLMQLPHFLFFHYLIAYWSLILGEFLGTTSQFIIMLFLLSYLLNDPSLSFSEMLIFVVPIPKLLKIIIHIYIHIYNYIYINRCNFVCM